MLFNSHEFIFGFLPATVIVFFALGLFSRKLALGWLVAASLFFYAWWRPANVLIIGPSILINYGLARTMQRLGERDGQNRASSVILAVGILFNIVFLGYFKYKNFLAGTVNDVFGADFVLMQVILPLGISFITFQKIAFLIDVDARRIPSFTFREYSLFVLFFPQLIAGPIVHFRELMPQFRDINCRIDATHVAVGLTLLFLGLFKKVVLADGIAPMVTTIYDQAAAGSAIPLQIAWMATVGFTLQIYFDFSGYSDIAIGAARIFGIRFPQNFDSPLRAWSIIDFWSRWHMTLTRFLTAYIYNPLVLSLTRRRLAKGRTPYGGKNVTVGGFICVLMVPTIVTMFISGLWHGAGHVFLVWGLLHGVYITINHAWRVIAPKLIDRSVLSGRLYNFVCFLLTFAAVSASMAFFRSSTLASAMQLVRGLMGLNGMGFQGAEDVPKLFLGIISLALIAFVFPNTLRVLSRYQPALGMKPPQTSPTSFEGVIAWNGSLGWAILTALIAIIGISRLGGPSEFLYWQF